MSGVFNKEVLIAPSLICLDPLNIERDVDVLAAAGIELLHVDILDGHFSPSMPLGLDAVKQLKKRSKLPLDCHVMANSNEFFINSLLDMGVEQITFHIETEPHIDAMLNRIRAGGARAGVALKPATPVDALKYAVYKCDCVLLMLINPGFAFLKTEAQVPYAAKKLEDLRQFLEPYGRDVSVIVDGRISEQNVLDWGSKLANVFVGGSTLLDTANLAASALALKELVP